MASAPPPYTTDGLDGKTKKELIPIAKDLQISLATVGAKAWAKATKSKLIKAILAKQDAPAAAAATNSFSEEVCFVIYL